MIVVPAFAGTALGKSARAAQSCRSLKVARNGWPG